MQETSPKPVKYIDRVKGPLVKPCPGAKGCLCCGYVVISHILGCPYSCSYCYLHTFYGKEEIVVVKDEDRIVEETKAYLNRSERPLRVGTGEFSDSLALPEARSLAAKLIKLFASQDKHVLELKTKSDQVDDFLDLDPNPNPTTVFAWSVNPERIVRSEESCLPAGRFGAVSLEARIKAAQKCVDSGYRVAFHFDPIIYFPGWEEEYERVVEDIFSNIPERMIAWISLGALRFPAAQKRIMREKFKTTIDFSYFEASNETKLRYPESLRIELFSQLSSAIRQKTKEVYIYLCMETLMIWEKTGLSTGGNLGFYWQNVV